MAHRISQAFELSQFISITSEAADFVLLMGDLNLMPFELGFKILRDNAFLLDSCTEVQVWYLTIFEINAKAFDILEFSSR